MGDTKAVAGEGTAPRFPSCFRFMDVPRGSRKALCLEGPSHRMVQGTLLGLEAAGMSAGSQSGGAKEKMQQTRSCISISFPVL